MTTIMGSRLELEHAYEATLKLYQRGSSMNCRSILAAYLSSLLCASIAFAETQEVDRHTEQHDTKIDANTGTVDQSHSTQSDHQSSQKSGMGASSSEEHIQAQKTVTDNGAGKVESQKSSRTSAEVTTEPNGDVAVKQQKEQAQTTTAK